MLFILPILFIACTSWVDAQNFASLQVERHPSFSWDSCTSTGGCSSQNGSLVLDQNWRWVHRAKDYTNCFVDGRWEAKNYQNESICPDDDSCTSNCVIDGTDYRNMGVWPKNDSLTLKYSNRMDYTYSKSNRLYMMDAENQFFELFELLNKEITFEIDVSKMPCGLSANLNFVSMPPDGGSSQFETNQAGAAFGTGYCDASCPRNLRFVNGVANVANWTQIPDDNFGDQSFGLRGSCCPQVDIFNGNSISTSFGLHPCDSQYQHECIGDSCGGIDSPISAVDKSSCDMDGCTFNPYRMGSTDFYGRGAKGVDTSKPFKVVTQFVTRDGSNWSPLISINRLYIQNGTKIKNPVSKVDGILGDSITRDFCTNQKAVFGDSNKFDKFGGLSKITEVLMRGMVMVIGLEDDRRDGMLWLDGKLGEGKGAARGGCPSPAVPIMELIENEGRLASMTISKIRIGLIGSTT
ncbi:exo-cellobiohydrolase [Amylocarpus encephaloides]|uniref:Glucanase n=1 Tax=Amylocarpus encephaloides TaxID=45428 RepID=A0A9P7YAM7_9HELO|nr:exo-cellobiohydrolase [Amylocarpus encephaloides]